MDFKVDDLVLQVGSHVDAKRFDIHNYDDFLDVLCREREYQKEAIREVVRFLLSGQYKNTSELAMENFTANKALQDLYGTADAFVQQLEFPDRLACSIDLATATGKSYVIYGIAQILLCEGAIDQVLVLCPSNTIERGLTSKFKLMSGNEHLKATLPSDAVLKNPSIANSSQTIRTGDVCVENIHATYERTGSSIQYSLEGRGERTLVLNDEAHHIFSPTDKQLKKWKQFLIDPKYNFHYVVGLTGTPYIQNEYFRDVVYRYSLAIAMEQKTVKLIKYLSKDEARNWNEKIQEIYDNHIQNKNRYPKLKPLTIFVTQKISGAERLAEDVTKFLMKKERIKRDAAEKKIIVVTSSDKHKANVEMLSKVDDATNEMEWITSVSMLTEGWDVKNVFQIVPHEERAFNSKLLVAQVLGRGLRVPEQYNTPEHWPLVTVFNHDSWSGKIKNIVEEVIGIERKVHSYIVEKETDYNFIVHNVSYKKVEKPLRIREKPDSYAAFPSKPIKLSSQDEEARRIAEYTQALSGRTEEKATKVEIEMWDVQDVAQHVYNKLFTFDPKLGELTSVKSIRKYIDKCLAEISDSSSKLTLENKRRIEDAYNVVKRRATTTLAIEREAAAVAETSTRELPKVACSVSMLRRTHTLILEQTSVGRSEGADRTVIEELQKDETLRQGWAISVANRFNFKSPQNLVILSHGNENEFGKRLAKEEYAKHIDAWVKSSDSRFYSIPYIYQRGSHSKDGTFNPDFFIKKGNDIIVVEIKSDEDASDVNKGKLKYAKFHFSEINAQLASVKNDVRYYFKFLSPSDFTGFFEKVKDGSYKTYRSNLEADLERE